jgi:putative ABC transport system permease protein
MKIMLVAVTERTREIGIRRAIGAKRRSVMIQFLLESSILSSAGGSVGVIGGIPLSVLVGKAFGWSVPILPAGTVLALGSSLFVAIISGLYPPHRASLLNLVDALRFE